ncbi:MAG TPA: hypothetical protein VG738_25370 [Chitinophagaceae bacterium]|nr:hypothetical protein [Chitinophagaceae bacterium]
MKKGWNITEKVIATILQAWALFYLYLLTMAIYSKLQFGLQTGGIKKEDISFWELFRMFHFNYIAGLLCFYAGLMLLYDRKKGWVTSVISTIIFAGFMLVSGRNGVMKDNNTHVMTSVSYLIAAVVFAAIFIVLVLKPFRVKYHPTTANWLFIMGVILLAVIDKTVFTL